MLRGRDLGLLETVVVVVEAGRARCGRVGHVHAVQRVRVLVPRAAKCRENCLQTALAPTDVLAVEHDLRRQILKNRPDVARGRHALQRVRVDARRDVGGRDVDRRRLADHRQRLAHLAGLERDVNGQRACGGDDEPLADDFLEPGELVRSRVVAERQRRKRVDAAGIGDVRPRRHQDGAAERHGDARHDRARLVDDLPLDRADLQRLSVSARGERDDQKPEENQDRSFQPHHDLPVLRERVVRRLRLSIVSGPRCVKTVMAIRCGTIRPRTIGWRWLSQDGRLWHGESWSLSQRSSCSRSCPFRNSVMNS